MRCSTVAAIVFSEAIRQDDSDVADEEQNVKGCRVRD